MIFLLEEVEKGAKRGVAARRAVVEGCRASSDVVDRRACVESLEVCCLLEAASSSWECLKRPVRAREAIVAAVRCVRGAGPAGGASNVKDGGAEDVG